MGVKTGLNDVFIVKRVDQTEDPSEVVVYTEGYCRPRTPQRNRSRYVARLESSLLRPLIRGENVEAWRYRIEDYMLWTHDDTTGRVLSDIPAKAKEYFQRHANALQARSDHRENLPIWQIFRVTPQKLRHKIIWQRISSTLGCVYVPPAVQDRGENPLLLVPLDTVYIVAVRDPNEGHIVAAWLNSSVSQAYTGSFARRDRGAYHHYDAWVIGLLPVPEPANALLRDGNASHPTLARMQELSSLLHDNPNRPDRSTLEQELDGLIASLYGLPPDGLAGLQNYFDFIRASEPPPRDRHFEEEAEETEQ
jgi:hypothetical protein